MDKKAPFTVGEQKIMDMLEESVIIFSSLDQTHPGHPADFYKAIDDLRDIIGHRVLQREYPETYPTKRVGQLSKPAPRMDRPSIDRS